MNLHQWLETQSPRVTLVLNFKLPTWNQLYAMSKWERQRVTNLLKDTISTSIREAGGSEIPTGAQVKVRLTDLQRAAYSEMIRPNTSQAYHFRKKVATRTRR